MVMLTRSQLDALLSGLRVKAVKIARDYPVGDQAKAISGEAETLESRVSANDSAYFHREVAALISDIGAVAPVIPHE